jgi:iron complex transport system ATP-binding protein
VSELRLRSLSVALSGAPILRQIDAELQTGEWLALVGPNGAGKSTLLRASAGLVGYQGSLRLDGAEVAGLGRRAVAARVAFVPQTPLLPPDMTVSEYVLLGRTPHLGYLASESRRDHEAAATALVRLDLDRFARRRLGSLSGGEAQRAVLARALAQQAPLLLLDEPTTALDVGRQQQVLELVEELRQEHGLTVLSAMHDLTLAGQYADRLSMLADGCVVASGTPAEVLTEQRVARFYQARVHVLDGPGGFAVVPRRHSPRVQIAAGRSER